MEREAVTRTKQQSVELFTLSQRPELEDQVELLHERSWDKFLDGAPWDYWDSLFDVFADYQLLLCHPHDTVVAAGHTVPFIWNGTVKDLPSTLDEIIERGLNAVRHGRKTTTLSALAAMVMPEQRNQGLSSLLVRAMRSLAARHGLESLVAPVGPILKHRYPLTPMERYMHWKRPDGSPFDPWIRVHWQLGAHILCVAPTTAISTGTVAQWEEWTGMSFPESGLYVVPGAQQPVDIDRERDIGRYEDPGVWMRHPLTPGEDDRADDDDRPEVR
ncbi:N-acetyltransferase [Streptomyces sp. NK08204]|uniref:N-acetyltransferase n=1 Tax=Streptomyces sp. NK08204 TaxID=2873260 RepID=UPI001CEC27C6|nr:N-acetyltransferase [Streptomyces sp. NK08204]